jgi:hypothetical protein
MRKQSTPISYIYIYIYLLSDLIEWDDMIDQNHFKLYLFFN